jgi:spermidine/putrescine ABC transporter ATP-binding subunit
MNAEPLAATASLTFTDISKSYGPVVALNGVSLSVDSGELLTILGPSGSGKTTLLKVVAGFEIPQEGSVLLGSQDVTETPPAKRNIGMVFQNYALFPHMTVNENVAFPLEMRKVAKAEAEGRVRRALDLVELGGYGDRLPSQLSGGQQQRVALARAVVFNPRILLLDEPFGALDRKLREAMQLEVKHLQRKLGLTTLFITHDQEEALILSDRIAVMNEGRIEQLSTPLEIYERPRSAFVADFIGESNIFYGEVETGSRDGVAIRLDSGMRLVADCRSSPVNGSRIGVMIRPERLRLLDGEGSASGNLLKGEVQEVIYLGVSYKYRVLTESGMEMLIRISAGAQDPVPGPGERFVAEIHSGNVHILQAE